METIQSIVEVTNIKREYKISSDSRESYSGTFAGFKITTTQQEIYLLIESSSQCCENFGYLLSEDNTSDFLLTELLDIKITDTELKTYKLYVNGSINDLKVEDMIMFVDIITNRGTLQFVVYNESNGYYGHKVFIDSNQLKYEVFM